MNVLFYPYFKKKLDIIYPTTSAIVQSPLILDGVENFYVEMPNTISQRPIATGEIVQDYQITQPIIIRFDALVTDRELAFSARQVLAGEFQGFTFFGKSKPTKAVATLFNIYLYKGYINEIISKYFFDSNYFIQKIVYRETNALASYFNFTLLKVRTPSDVTYTNSSIDPTLELP